MVFQGRYTYPGGSDDRHTGWEFYNGEYSLEPTGGSITMSATRDHMGRGPRSSGGPILKYNANRQVTGVPVIDGPSHLIGYFALHSYTITTDTGVTVVAAPEPPAADVVTVTQEVSGIKISELNAADSLSDTDLFVLSRDDPAGVPYDESLNVTLTKLGQSIGVTAAHNTGFLDTHGGVAVENGATLTITHNLGTVDLLVKIFAAKDADGTGNMEVQWQTGNLSIPDGYGAQVVEMEPNYIKLQLGASGLLFLNSSGNDAAPGDAGGRSYSPGALGGRWNFIKVLCVKVS